MTCSNVRFLLIRVRPMAYLALQLPTSSMIYQTQFGKDQTALSANQFRLYHALSIKSEEELTEINERSTYIEKNETELERVPAIQSKLEDKACAKLSPPSFLSSPDSLILPKTPCKPLLPSITNQRTALPQSDSSRNPGPFQLSNKSIFGLSRHQILALSHFRSRVGHRACQGQVEALLKLAELNLLDHIPHSDLNRLFHSWAIHTSNQIDPSRLITLVQIMLVRDFEFLPSHVIRLLNHLSNPKCRGLSQFWIMSMMDLLKQRGIPLNDEIYNLTVALSLLDYQFITAHNFLTELIHNGYKPNQLILHALDQAFKAHSKISYVWKSKDIEDLEILFQIRFMLTNFHIKPK